MTTNTSISKRTLLKGSAAALAVGVLPTWRRAQAADKYDLIVMGAGTAGMPAAIFAAERGANVLVVEKSPVLGGTLDRSGGQISGAGTVFQKEEGIEDTPDAHYDDYMRISNNTVDPVITRLFVDNAGDSINWLAANGFKPLDGHPVLGGGHEYFTTRRYHWGKDGGRSILAAMEPVYKSHEKAGKITTLMSTGVVDLIQDNDGAVVGVTAESDKGKLTDYMGKHVILACGGCASNPRMFADLHDGKELTALFAYPYSQGAGLTLGLSVGGTIRGGEKYLASFGTVLQDDVYPSSREVSFTSRPDVRPAWEVFVNSDGKRFMREDHPSVDYREHRLTEQSGQRAWIIADQTIMDQAPMAYAGWDKKKLMKAFDEHPMFVRADSLEVLGVKAGINPAELEKSIADYNQALENGQTDAFGREHRPLPVKNGPFYAVRITGISLLSFAGLTVDGQLRVVREDGSPVPNLYAAGEVIGAGQTSGNSYCNGSMVTPAVTFGRLLGQKMLNFSV